MANSVHSTAVPKIDRRNVMLRAWAKYRQTAKECRYQAFSRTWFNYELKLAWAAARREAEEAVLDAAPVALATPVALAPKKQARADEIRSDLAWMEMGNFIDWPLHRNLSAELSRLGA